MNLPRLLERLARLEPLDLPATAGVGKVEAAGQRDLRPAVAVDVAGGQVDVPLGPGHGPPAPTGILVPVDAIAVGRQRDHVQLAVAIHIGHGHLVAARILVDVVTDELGRLCKECHGGQQE